MTTQKKAAPDALQGIEGESTETRSKETTTITTLLDTRPTTTVDCHIPGCSAHPANHNARDTAADWLHDLAPLPGHAFDVSPSKSGASAWAGWVQVDTSARLLSAAELRELSAVLAAEATRVDALNAAAAARLAVTA